MNKTLLALYVCVLVLLLQNVATFSTGGPVYATSFDSDSDAQPQAAGGKVRSSAKLPKDAVSVLDFGARCDGAADDTRAIQAALDSATPVTALLPTGTCVTSDTLRVAHVGVNIAGKGQRNSFIRFKPSTPGKAAILMQNANGRQELGMNSLRDFTLVSGNGAQKVGVRMVDTEENVFSYGCQGWYDAAHRSICLQVQGRQMGKIVDSNFFADIPVSLEQNPRSIYSADHFTFENIYMLGDRSQPCVRVADGVALSNVEFVHSAYVLCSNVLAWTSSSGPYTSYKVTFKGGRWEQSTARDFGFKLALSGTAGVQQLHVEDMYLGGEGGSAQAFYLRHCHACEFQTVTYSDPGTYLDTDAFDATSQLHWNILRHVDSTIVAPSSLPGLVYFGTIAGGVSTSGLSIGNFNNRAGITLAAGQSFAGASAAGSGSVAIAGLTAGDRPIFDPSAKGAVFGGGLQLYGSGPAFLAGNGPPNGIVTGRTGDLYLNRAGGAASTLYVKESGSGTSTGWVAK